MAFISCTSRLTKVLVGAARGKKVSKVGGGQVTLPDVDTGRMLGLKYKLIYHFKLAADMIREFVNVTLWSVYFYSWWKLQCWLKAPLSFHRGVNAMQMSTDLSGRFRTLSFLTYFYHVTFPGFPFVLIFYIWVSLEILIVKPYIVLYVKV